LIYGDLSTEILKSVRAQIAVFEHRREDLY
jgi:hypothetical protein